MQRGAAVIRPVQQARSCARAGRGDEVCGGERERRSGTMSVHGHEYGRSGQAAPACRVSVRNGSANEPGERRPGRRVDVLVRDRPATPANSAWAAADPEPEQSSWKCVCGTANTGKFCSSAKPRPERPDLRRARAARSIRESFARIAARAKQICKNDRRSNVYRRVRATRPTDSHFKNKK